MTKKTNTANKLVLTTIVLVLISAGSIFAAGSTLLGGSFTDSVISARAAGFGGAFTAVADDANASWWNPAGLAFLGKDKSISATYIPQVYSDIKGMSDMLVSYGQGDIYGFGAIGGSVRYMNTEIGADYTGDTSFKWSEFTVLLSWAMQIEKYIGLSKFSFPKISLGVNLKYFGNNTDMLLGTEKITASGFGADLALMFALKENLRIGLMGRNIFSQITWQTGTKEALPYEIAAGLYYGLTSDLMLSFDGKFIQTDSGAPAFDTINGGAEYNMVFGKTAQIQEAAIRAGISYLLLQDSFVAAIGASISMETFSVDYAYQHYIRSQTNVSNHRFGLTVFF